MEKASLFFRVSGIETEYALVFYPRDDLTGNPSLQPDRKRIFQEIETVLSQDFPSLKSRCFEEGVFLLNGACVHYESQVDYFRQGLLEASTPECSSPKEVVIYQRALDQILMDALPQVEQNLADWGYFGKLVIGKNSTDNKGNFYGCHENYLVRESQGKIRQFFLALGFSFFFLLSLPFFFLIFLPLFLATSLWLWGIIVYGVLQIAISVPRIRFLATPPLQAMKWLYKRVSQMEEKLWTQYYGGYFKYVLYPFVLAYSFFLSLFLFRKIRHLLTAHLITRQIYTGSGSFTVDKKDGCFYQLSQRARAIFCQFCVYWDEKFRPMYDVKNFLRSPLSLFFSQKRLHLLPGDANLAPLSNYLKMGTTTLILAMIEAGHPLEKFSLKRPIHALRTVSRDLTFETKLSLWGKPSMSALEIQRYYLSEAKSFYQSSKIGSIEAQEILTLWETVLTAIEQKEWNYLSQNLDWAIKKSLLDSALWGKGGMEDLSKAVPLVQRIEKILREGEGTLKERLKDQLSAKELARWERSLTKKDLSWDQLDWAYQLYYQLLKIDLKYHQLGEGYYFQLEKEMVGRDEIFSEEEIFQAMTIPPARTRAQLRGYLIDHFSDLGEMAQVNWESFVANLDEGLIKIKLRDPHQYEFNEKQKKSLEVLQKFQEEQ